MTDKKIKSLIENRWNDWKYGSSTEAKYKAEECKDILELIDSLPVSSIWHDASKKSDNLEDVVIINPSDNTGEVLTKCTGVNQGNIWAYTSELLKLDNPCNTGKNLQEPQVKESLEFQHKEETCKENGNSLTQESVSDELEKAAIEAFKQIVDSDKNNFLEIFKAGANWQKKRDYIPLSDDINEVAKQICNKVLNCEIDYMEDDVVLSDEEECVKAGIRWQMQKEIEL